MKRPIEVTEAHRITSAAAAEIKSHEQLKQAQGKVQRLIGLPTMTPNGTQKLVAYAAERNLKYGNIGKTQIIEEPETKKLKANIAIF